MKQTSFILRTLRSILITILTCTPLQSTMLVPLPSVISTQAIPVLSKVFDRATGTLYLGFYSGANTYAISTLHRPSGLAQPTLIPMPESASTISTNAIYNLALASAQGEINPNIAFIIGSPNGTTIGATNNTFTLISNLISPINSSGAATGSPNSLAANKCFIFTGVTSSLTPLGGIAVIGINLTTLALQQTAAQPGSSDVKARILNNTTAEAGLGDFGITVPYKLHWDDPLRRLYIGYNIASNDETGVRSIIVAHTRCGALIYSPIAPDSVFTGIDAQNYTVLSTGSTLSVLRVDVLHASTGPSYLIVNGGLGTPTASGVGNEIYALPLVDDLSNEDAQGTLAAKDAPLVNYKFIVPATLPTDLASTNDLFTLVGAGPLPFVPATTSISDMVVVGDTVYACMFNQPDALNETGIFYSQALFDSQGKIARWTPWTKRAFPIGGIPDVVCPCRIKFFDVDALTGKIWGIGGDAINTIATTWWDHGQKCCCPIPVTQPCEPIPAKPIPLVIKLNQTLCGCCCNCYSALDLDASTRGFELGATAQRYALFGGNNKVAFARISESNSAGIQEVIQDYSLLTNYRLTDLPENAGCVTTLEYARRLANENYTNYFFAGTPSGLYVFANTDQSGFSVATLRTLDLPPFSTGQWSKAPNIPGSIIDIKTTGQVLYVLARETSCANPCICTLYKIYYQSDISSMFATSNIEILAQTMATPPFDNVHLFTGMQIVVSGLTGEFSFTNIEQIVLTTNNGVYQTTAPAGTQDIGITNQDLAQWIALDNPKRMYTGIAGMDNASLGFVTPATYAYGPSTVWPISLDDTACYQNIFQRSSIHQLACSLEYEAFTLPAVIPCAFVPPHFNDSLNCFKTLLPTTYFWTDGARRFFIVHNKSDKAGKTRLMVTPFNIKEWNVWNPDQLVIVDPPISTVCDFYWVRTIGMSGIIMAGTNNGVVALE